MLKLLNEKDWLIATELDPDGNAVKITCDGLEVAAMGIDAATQPVPGCNVAYKRIVLSTRKSAGLMVMHIITGLDLAEMLEHGDGLTIKRVELSAIETGIPSEGIAAEDLEWIEYEVIHHWIERLRQTTKENT
jgi:hypothetical protein